MDGPAARCSVDCPPRLTLHAWHCPSSSLNPATTLWGREGDTTAQRGTVTPKATHRTLPGLGLTPVGLASAHTLNTLYWCLGPVNWAHLRASREGAFRPGQGSLKETEMGT